MKRMLFPALLLAAVAGCTPFPDLDFTQTAALEAAPYPTLVPIEPILASVDAAPTDAATETAALNARVAGLRARANRLRGSVLSGAERNRLQAGLR